MKFPWRKKKNKNKIEYKDSDKQVNFIEKNVSTDLQSSNIQNNEVKDEGDLRKVRIDNDLYSFSSLPNAAKETLNLLTKSDQLIKIYSQKLDILSFSRKSLGESLKNNLKSIKELNMPD
tara:strand:+ start:75 stop:431 length:357 start_codon:yes stop_codon:yes gene_type:complete